MFPQKAPSATEELICHKGKFPPYGTICFVLQLVQHLLSRLIYQVAMEAEMEIIHGNKTLISFQKADLATNIFN
jgi:hypothetical protein